MIPTLLLSIVNVLVIAGLTLCRVLLDPCSHVDVKMVENSRHLPLEPCFTLVCDCIVPGHSIHFGQVVSSVDVVVEMCQCIVEDVCLQ